MICHSPSGDAKQMVAESEKEKYTQSTPVDQIRMSGNNTAYNAVTGMYVCMYVHKSKKNIC